MKKTEILRLGWGIFGFFLLLGSICLFGCLVTGNNDFAIGGYLLLLLGTIINTLIFVIFLVCAFTDRSNKKYWIQSAGILLLNIPIAFLYAYIGLEII